MNIVLIIVMGWVGGLALAGFGVWAGIRIYARKKKGLPLSLAIAGGVIMILAIVLWFTATAVGQQTVQSWNAQSQGIYREVAVYSMTGEQIAEYKGVFNIEYDSERVEIFNVENGTRVMIYYKNGTVIVTEPDALGSGS